MGVKVTDFQGLFNQLKAMTLAYEVSEYYLRLPITTAFDALAGISKDEDTVYIGMMGMKEEVPYIFVCANESYYLMCEVGNAVSYLTKDTFYCAHAIEEGDLDKFTEMVNSWISLENSFNHG